MCPGISSHLSEEGIVEETVYRLRQMRRSPAIVSEKPGKPKKPLENVYCCFALTRNSKKTIGTFVFPTDSLVLLKITMCSEVGGGGSGSTLFFL